MPPQQRRRLSEGIISFDKHHQQVAGVIGRRSLTLLSVRVDSSFQPPPVP
jgi:hypothetical protein